VERNQRHPISGVRSFGPGKQIRRAGEKSIRGLEKNQVYQNKFIRDPGPMAPGFFFMTAGATNCRRDNMTHIN